MEMVTACEQGHLDIVIASLEGGVDVNEPFYKLCRDCFDADGQPLENPLPTFGRCPCFYNGDSYLKIAVERGQTEVVKVLVERGADQDFKDINGDTPLMLAASYGYIDTVKELLVLGSDWNCTNWHSQNTLDILYLFNGEECRQEMIRFITEMSECNLKPAKKSD